MPEPEIGIVLYRGEPNGYTIENIEEIPTVEGIDIGFLGPYDLSQSLAIPGQVTHKRVEEMMTKVCELADKTDTVVGTFADSPEIANKWIAAGAHYAALGVKVRMFTEHLASVTNAVDTESEWALLITV